MTRTIDFYFDFPSPYSYLAHTQLPKIAAEHGATVTYHPFRLLELMTIVGCPLEYRYRQEFWVRSQTSGKSRLNRRAPPRGETECRILVSPTTTSHK